MAKEAEQRDAQGLPIQVDLDDVSLASEEEIKLIGALRDELKPELTALRESGCDFQHTSGDLFMLRVLRGNERDIPQAATWYRNFLAKRKEHNLDAVYKKYDEGGLTWSSECMPHYAELRKHYTAEFDEGKLKSAQGHLIMYDAPGEINAGPLMELKDKLLEFFCYLVEGRLVCTDRLSLQEGRLVKTLRIMDFDGFGPWRVGPKLMQFFRGTLMPLLLRTSAESIHRNFMINANWFPAKVYDVLKPHLSLRFQGRNRLFGHECMQNEEFASCVSPALMAELASKRRGDCDEGASLEGTAYLIKAGGTMNRSLPVQEGARFSWEFRMGSIEDGKADGVAVRGLAGKLLDKGLGEASDIKFSVTFWTDSGAGMDEDCNVKEQVLVPTTPVDAKADVVSGSAVAPGSGTVVFCWSNANSWVRAKLVAQYKISLS